MLKGDCTLLKKAKVGREIDKLRKELNSEIDKELKTIDSRAVEIYKNFTEMCFMLSKLDGTMSFKEIEKLSVTNFYQLKEWLKKQNKPTKNKTQNE